MRYGVFNSAKRHRVEVPEIPIPEFSMSLTLASTRQTNLPYEAERIDLACAFRWTVRFGWNEAVANHSSLAVNDSGTQFLMNPNQVHFSPVVDRCG